MPDLTQAALAPATSHATLLPGACTGLGLSVVVFDFAK